jgi:hypothetical protein
MPAALLAFAPKCVLCVLAYAGIGTALGLGGPEICGGPGGSTGSWATWLLGSGAALGVIGLLACRPRRRSSPCDANDTSS